MEYAAALRLLQGQKRWIKVLSRRGDWRRINWLKDWFGLGNGTHSTRNCRQGDFKTTSEAPDTISMIHHYPICIIQPTQVAQAALMLDSSHCSSRASEVLCPLLPEWLRIGRFFSRSLKGLFRIIPFSSSYGCKAPQSESINSYYQLPSLGKCTSWRKLPTSRRSNNRNKNET